MSRVIPADDIKFLREAISFMEDVLPPKEKDGGDYIMDGDEFSSMQYHLNGVTNIINDINEEHLQADQALEE